MLLLLWVLIMETKRVEIPGSVLDDLCRYRGAPRCPGPLWSSRSLFPLRCDNRRGLPVSPPAHILALAFPVPPPLPFPGRPFSRTTPLLFSRRASLFLTPLPSFFAEPRHFLIFYFPNSSVSEAASRKPGSFAFLKLSPPPSCLFCLFDFYRPFPLLPPAHSLILLKDF